MTNNLTIDSARKLLASREISVLELVEYYLERIERINPHYNIYLRMNQHIQEEAARADTVIASNPRVWETQPLFGLPYALKDNFLVKGFEITASSKVLKGFVAPYSATVVEKLTQAGALLLGITNMDAWAHGSSTETSDFGPTLNPWNKDHLPGGSSGGSAAAVAADLCVFAIGSETAGSIRQPASWCGVTGFKPTYGMVSRYGVVAMASSTDSPGPLAKNVEDCALLTSVLAGKDPYDATTLPGASSISFVPSDVKWSKIKLAIPKEYMSEDLDPEVLKLVRTAIAVFKSQGAKVDEISLLDPKYSIAVYTIVQRSEVSSNLSRYQGIRYGHPRAEFGQEAKRRIMLGTFALSSGYYDAYYKKAQQVRTMIRDDFDKVFESYDAIIAPVSPCVALKVGASKDAAMFGELQDLLLEASSIAGLTGLSVPCGFSKELPVGLQITGQKQTENVVLSLGKAYQQLTSFHQSFPDISL